MVQVHENISLKPYNTFGIDVTSKYFSPFSTSDELQNLLKLKHQTQNSPLVLGGGSNILFTKNYDGLVLKNEISGIDVVKEDDEYVFLKAGGGVNWHQLVLYCIDNNYAGLENLSLIPGSVGASPMQNIGAYGVEIKDVFFELEALHVKEHSLVTFSNKDCAFGYRESVFKNIYKSQYVILNVTYRLNKIPKFNINYGAIQQELEKMGVMELSIKAISQAVINIRTSKLPDQQILGNAGSFFKNPQIGRQQLQELQKSFPNIPFYEVAEQIVKVPAGWLIEKCGWKGYRKGDAGCYEKQALVLVNYGKALGREILELSNDIIESVKNKFDITLEREVNIM